MKTEDMKQELVTLGNGAHALAIQILGNSEEAADAVHDAFARVLARPEAYDRQKGPLRPWFYRVVRNQCIDLVRRRRSSDAEVDELPAATALPEQSLEASQRDRMLHEALSRLSTDQRQILVLRDYLDLSYAEISDVLDIAGGTVMSRLHRARLALKEVLTRHER